ncbi:MAG TPA: zonular occludens toxin domain-containing protein [Arsenophonus sp.]
MSRGKVETHKTASAISSGVIICNFIIPAFIKGRWIVTNIYGISVEKITAYCLEKKKADDHLLGDTIRINNEQIKEANFFPFKTETGIAENTFWQACNLIYIDEAWCIWENNKIPEQHRSFIAEHGHFVNSQGVTCDLVLLNQSVANLPRFIKDRIEIT